MDSAYIPPLDWIATRQARMVQLTTEWAEINSGSYNRDGLRTMCAALEQAFAPLGGESALLPLAPIEQIDNKGELITIPMTECLSIRKRPEAPFQVLLVGHMDTVYGADHPFQQVTLNGNEMNGPGVADLKGGLAVMLHALLAFEQCPWRDQLGWQVLLNPDEEIGSIASDQWLKQAADGKNIGLVYEPALADGTLAGARKGSGNFTITVRGRAAHAGRNPEEGRNAIVLAAEITQGLFALNDICPGLTINPGKIEGGGALNVVPDLAILRFNIRTKERQDEAVVISKIDNLLNEFRERNGFGIAMHGQFTRSPKPLASAIQPLFDLVLETGHELGMLIPVKPSGGCCDGNNLWKYGLPNVDTLGVCGANIHSTNEIALVDSFVARAQLSALLLTKLAEAQSKNERSSLIFKKNIVNFSVTES